MQRIVQTSSYEDDNENDEEAMEQINKQVGEQDNRQQLIEQRLDRYRMEKMLSREERENSLPPPCDDTSGNPLKRLQVVIIGSEFICFRQAYSGVKISFLNFFSQFKPLSNKKRK